MTKNGEINPTFEQQVIELLTQILAKLEEYDEKFEDLDDAVRQLDPLSDMRLD